MYIHTVLDIVTNMMLTTVVHRRHKMLLEGSTTRNFIVIVRVIKSRRLEWKGHVARIEEARSSFKVLKCKPTGNIPLGTSRRRLNKNI